METEDLSDEALVLLCHIRACGYSRHFDAYAAWELIVRGLADLRQDPFRIEISSNGERTDHDLEFGLPHLASKLP